MQKNLGLNTHQPKVELKPRIDYDEIPVPSTTQQLKPGITYTVPYNYHPVVLRYPFSISPVIEIVENSSYGEY